MSNDNNTMPVLAVALVAILMSAALFGAIAVANSNHSSDTKDTDTSNSNRYSSFYTDDSSRSSTVSARSYTTISYDVDDSTDIIKHRAAEKVADSVPAKEETAIAAEVVKEETTVAVEERCEDKDGECFEEEPADGIECPCCGASNDIDSASCWNCFAVFQTYIEQYIDEVKEEVPEEYTTEESEEELAAEPAAEEEVIAAMQQSQPAQIQASISAMGNMPDLIPNEMIKLANSEK